MLDISKIEADKIELSPENVELRDVVEVVTATIEPIAAKNANQLVVELHPDLAPIFADRMRLRQVLLNLLGNACKFTNEGQVSVHAFPIDRSGSPWVELQVKDTGIGITPEQQAKLFQPFVQVDSSTTRAHGGSGLGLVICKRLVELMGGDIALGSKPGVGTTVTVRLPVGSDPAKSAPIIAPLEPDGGPAPKVLLIDDDAAVRDLFSRSLAKRGFRVYVAASGAEGIELAAQLEPSAIVLDVKMPGMSGWEVLSTLKLSEATSRIPVIMLTMLHQREVGQALGAVDYLIKPIAPSTLVETLRRYVGVTAAKVLVVEDDEPTRELIRRTLEGEGYSVVEAENGEVALARVHADDPDIVVLDLMMPVMDGFEFLRHLRDDAERSDLPVVVATARILSDQERRDLAKKAQRVIEKTAYGRQELIDAISSQIHEMVARGREAQ